MSDRRSAALLSPEGAPLTDPAEVEAALAVLWKPAGERAQAGARTEGVTRVCAANLLVVGCADRWPEISEALGELSPEYPTRTIVVLLGPSGSPGERPQAVTASVSALCHVRQPGRPQVCCEQIVLRSPAPCGHDLDRTILPLLEPDVALAIWWTFDPSSCPELFGRLRSMADRLIIDTGLAGLGHLESAGGCTTRELGWYRTYRWREQLAQVFDGFDPHRLAEIERVCVTVEGEADDGRVDAIWLVAFLGGQLGWQPHRTGEGGTCVLASQSHEVSVALNARPGPHPELVSASMDAGAHHFEIRRCTPQGREFRIITCDAQACELHRTVHVPHRRPGEALVPALTGRRTDASFDRAAPLAAWMAKALRPMGRRGAPPPCP